jgi:hypothetical protein
MSYRKDGLDASKDWVLYSLHAYIGSGTWGLASGMSNIGLIHDIYLIAYTLRKRSFDHSTPNSAHAWPTPFFFAA